MTGTVRVSPARALGAPGVAVRVADDPAVPGVGVAVDPGDVPVSVEFDLRLRAGRVSGSFDVVVSVPPGAEIDVRVPWLDPAWLRPLLAAAAAG